MEFVVYPFSFAEFIELYHTVYPNTDNRQCFSKYLTAGGMPYLSNLRYDETASRQYLRDLWGSVELKISSSETTSGMWIAGTDHCLCDLQHWHHIFLHRHFQVSEKRGRSVSPETVLSYIKACTDAFLFYQVKRQDLQGRKILTVNEKYYVADHGIRKPCSEAI